MELVRLYTSTQACPKVLNLALDLQLLGKQVVLLSLSRLPTPAPESRTASLRREHAERQAELARVQAAILASERGRVAYVPGQLDGLRFDEQSLLARLRALARALAAQSGERRVPDE